MAEQSEIPLSDEALVAAVREVVSDETRELAESKRLTITEQTFPRDAVTTMSLKPANPAASPLSLSIWGDTVGFEPGANGAGFEIWTSGNPDWSSDLRELNPSSEGGALQRECPQRLGVQHEGRDAL